MSTASVVFFLFVLSGVIWGVVVIILAFLYLYFYFGNKLIKYAFDEYDG